MLRGLIDVDFHIFLIVVGDELAQYGDCHLLELSILLQTVNILCVWTSLTVTDFLLF